MADDSRDGARRGAPVRRRRRGRRRRRAASGSPTLSAAGHRRGARARAQRGAGRRSRRGLGAELARVDRRRTRCHDRGCRARPGEHALPRRRSRVHPVAQQRARAVHRPRLPRHRLSRAPRRVRRRPARTRTDGAARRRRRTTPSSAGTTFLERGNTVPSRSSRRVHRSRSRPTIRATSCSRPARPAVRRAW